MTNLPQHQALSEDITIRPATAEDLPEVIALLVDDVLGAGRETFDEQSRKPYEQAFEQIEADPRNDVLIALVDGEVIGCLQLTLIPNLSFKGGLRAQIEALRVKAEYRGQGLGARLVSHAIDVARANKCRMVQLTSNKTRNDAIRFYEGLGFEPTHVGFKLYL